MIDRTTVDRRIESRQADGPLVDVRIEVEHTDDEQARECADEIAQAVQEVIRNG